MANTYCNILLHTVFKTKKHVAWLKPDVCERLYPYINGIVDPRGIKILAIGGTCDHLHLLLSFPPEISVSKVMQQIKGGTSRWIHETFPNLKFFAWQEGFGAFSIGQSQIEATQKYIANQIAHHTKRTFREEYLAFLKKNHIPYDERYIFE
jgi:REP element-mobilizing transposase RayT